METRSSDGAKSNLITKLLSDTLVSALPTPKGTVVVVKSTETPFEGFKKISEHNILSAPVYDEVHHKYTGFLDMRDLVSFVVFIDDDQKSETPNDLKTLILHGTKMLKVPLEGATVTYLSRRNPFHPVLETDNLLSVCNVLIKGVHRVPVVNPSGEVLNIISQSSIIQFLNQQLPKIKTELEKELKSINIGTKPVICVKKIMSAGETFRLMDKRKISGVAVIDEESGALVGNTSSSDLKLFIRSLSMESLNMPIMQFLNKIRQEHIDIRMPTITCSPRDTLAFLIEKLSATKIHKIFIADDSNGYKPMAVVSITDVLKYILSA